VRPDRDAHGSVTRRSASVCNIRKCLEGTGPAVAYGGLVRGIAGIDACTFYLGAGVALYWRILCPYLVYLHTGRAEGGCTSR
jgi:hypothetical protein